jgi:quercetin dioxygenase-like cupin family protein
VRKHFLPHKGEELIYVLKGSISVAIEGREEILHEGDSVYLKEEHPDLWRNKQNDDAELLVVCL